MFQQSLFVYRLHLLAIMFHEGHDARTLYYLGSKICAEFYLPMIEKHPVRFKYIYRSIDMAFAKREFSSLSLAKSDQKDIWDWAEKNKVNPLDSAIELGLEGYKLSFTWIDEQQSWCVSLIGTETTKPNQDKIMTSWSNDLGEAIVISAYKHAVLCDRGAWPIRSDEDGRWG